jgi:hypothetical protein
MNQRPSRTWAAVGTVAVLLTAFSCSKAAGPKTGYDIQSERMMRSEAVYLALNNVGALKPVSEDLMNLRFPSSGSRSLFEDQVVFAGLVEEWPAAATTFHDGTIQERRWQVASEAKTVPFAEVKAYDSLFAQVEYFKKAKFKFYIPVPTWRDKETMREWEATIAIDAKAKLKNGNWAYVNGKSRVLFRLQPESYDEEDPNEQVWKIAEWKCNDLVVQETEQWLFQEVLEEALPDPAQLTLARRSVHHENVAKFLKGEFKKPYDSWMIAAGPLHPTVGVVDVDKDGHDDIYLQPRVGVNQFFKSNGDGTFRECAAELGLAFPGETSSTAFVDFDNDGDLDAFVGGSRVRSILLENVNGKFVDRSGDKIATEDLPMHVSMLNAVDYDGDGLLDIYVSTYAGYLVQRAIRGMAGATDQGLGTAVAELRDSMLPSEWAKLEPMVKGMIGSDARYNDRPGPPNVMLKNMGGGRFERAPDCQELLLTYNSFAASWSDYDNDGDPDVYVANDFAPNQLMRNEGGGKFTPMSPKLKTEDVGFGMGVTWGDYDHDGRNDLYVTNMFSKANRRVVSFFLKDGDNFDAALIGDNPLDPVYERLGAGNTLFRNMGNDEPWEKVSGMAKPKFLVEEGGWGWGAMFLDVDNDGWDDLYGPAGYYTAPQESSIPVDL